MIRSNSFNEIYLHILNELNTNPEYSTKTTREILNYHFVLTDIINNTISIEARGFKPDYAEAFFEYVYTGDISEETIKRLGSINVNAKKFLVEFEGRNTQYGPRINEQLPEIIEELKTHNESRRASILILDKEDRLFLKPKADGKTTIEYPCTSALHFELRDNKLNLVVQMRSQSAVMVLVYDLFNWTNLIMKMTEILRDTYPDIQYGNLYYSAASMHYYHSEQPLVDKILSEAKEKGYL